MTEFKETELDERAIKMAKVLSADAVEKAGSGHPGPPPTLAPFAYTLYQHFIKHDPNDPNWEGRDRFTWMPMQWRKWCRVRRSIRFLTW